MFPSKRNEHEYLSNVVKFIITIWFQPLLKIEHDIKYYKYIFVYFYINANPRRNVLTVKKKEPIKQNKYFADMPN